MRGVSPTDTAPYGRGTLLLLPTHGVSIFQPTISSANEEQTGNNQGGEVGDIMNSESAFARNLMKSFKYNLHLHFPKAVKKMKGDGFTAAGKEVSFRGNFIDVMQLGDNGFQVQVRLK